MKIFCRSIGVLLMLLSAAGFAKAKTPAPLDSVGIEKKDGKTYVLHKVESKETLFSIARKYRASVTDIKAANPGLEAAVNKGQVLKIPLKPQAKEPVSVKPQTFNHTVVPGQSLSAIARLYNVKTSEIKEWNKLTDNNIKAGQKLSITSSTLPGRREAAGPAKTEAVLPLGGAKTDTGKEISEGSGYERIKETGFAEIIEEDKTGKKNLCLHRTAPAGTIIEVKNETNGNTIFVRVIGKLPDTGPNEKLIVRLSRPAFEKLGALNKRFPVEISYLAPGQ